MRDLGDIKTKQIIINEKRFLRLTIDNQDFDLPFKKLGNKTVAFLDISGKFKLIEYCADKIVKKLMDENVGFDTILNPVSKSNALAHAVAVRWAKENNSAMTYTIVARKSAFGNGKNTGVPYHSVTTADEQYLSLIPDDAAFIRGKRLLLMDDVYGEGGTFGALVQLTDNANAIIAAKAVIAIEAGNKNVNDVIYLFELPTINDV